MGIPVAQEHPGFHIERRADTGKGEVMKAAGLRLEEFVTFGDELSLPGRLPS